MSADKTSVERNGAICYNIFKFKNHSRYNLNEELDTCLKLHSNKKQKLEKCRKRAAETSEFCRSPSEYEMYLTKAKCAASYLW